MRRSFLTHPPSRPTLRHSLSVTPIVIVSDVALVRDCLRIILSRQAGIEVVGAASARCAFSDISMLAAKVALLDASIEDGPSLWHFVRERLPSTSLIVFDMAGGDARFLAWAEAGVMGYVGGDCSLPELVRAIRGALQGEKVVPSRLAGLLLGHVARLSDKRGAGSKSSALTAREREILDMIAEGMSNKSVALRLGVMESTVKNSRAQHPREDGCPEPRRSCGSTALRPGEFWVASRSRPEDITARTKPWRPTGDTRPTEQESKD